MTEIERLQTGGRTNTAVMGQEERPDFDEVSEFVPQTLKNELIPMAVITPWRSEARAC